MRRTATIIALLLAASCSSKAKPEPTPAATPAPTTVTPTATTAPTASPKVDARKVDAAPLVAPHHVTRVIYGDMDGDGTEEIAVWSQAAEPPSGSFLKQSYIDVFAFRDGRFTKVFDAVKEGVVNEEANDVSQEIAYFTLLDFRADGQPYLALGVQNVGASNGPLDIWAIRWDGSGPFDKEFKYSTDRGGTLVREGNTLALDTGAYKPSDPGCCPSAIAHIVIAYKDGKVQIASRTEKPTNT